MDWPARSPDMYPIEHFGDQTMVFIRDMNEPPFIVPEMWRAVIQAWVVILPRRVMTLVDWYTACHIPCIDKTLGYISVHWQRDNGLSRMKWFGSNTWGLLWLDCTLKLEDYPPPYLSPGNSQYVTPTSRHRHDDIAYVVDTSKSVPRYQPVCATQLSSKGRVKVGNIAHIVSIAHCVKWVISRTLTAILPDFEFQWLVPVKWILWHTSYHTQDIIPQKHILYC